MKLSNEEEEKGVAFRTIKSWLSLKVARQEGAAVGSHEPSCAKFPTTRTD